jgi:hypothetical protein
MWTIEAYDGHYHLSREGINYRIPRGSAGADILYNMLVDFRMAPESKIATAAFPTQSIIDEALRNWYSAVPKEKAKLDLSELGL